MYRAWSVSANDPSLLARLLEAHLNEFAAEVITVGYAVTDAHHALAVYRALEAAHEPGVEAALAAAENIVGL